MGASRLRWSTFVLAVAAAVAVATAALGAGEARAVVLHADGKVFSYMPPRRATVRPFDNVFGNVDYNGGPVMPSNTDYLVFWSPGGYGAYGPGSNTNPPQYVTGLEQYFTDLAHDSGGNQNVDSVSAQYGDAGGNFARYDMTYGGALLDTDRYPGSGCRVTKPNTNCLTDSQMQTELGRYLTAHHLPRDLQHAYFLLTPPPVQNCFDGNPNDGCSVGEGNYGINDYCAYHNNSTAAPVLVYAIDPYVTDDTGQNGCDDGNHPNGDSDGAIEGGLSHEHNEIDTDPIPGSAWVNAANGEEIGDQCDTSMGTTLGTAPDNSPYNQIINGHFYWYQEEWSNQGDSCEQSFTPSGTPPGASFTVTAATKPRGTMNFDASGSGSGIAQYNWQFNDAPGLNYADESTSAQDTHAFRGSGLYDVALTTFAADGTSTGTGGLISPGHSGFVPGFSISAKPKAHARISFRATNSLDGASLTGYSWDFGDGTPTATGASSTHVYALSGIYKVTVTMFNTNLGTAVQSVQSLQVG